MFKEQKGFRLRAWALEEGKMRMRKVELKGRRRGNKVGRILHTYLYFFPDYVSRTLGKQKCKEK